MRSVLVVRLSVRSVLVVRLSVRSVLVVRLSVRSVLVVRLSVRTVTVVRLSVVCVRTGGSPVGAEVGSTRIGHARQCAGHSRPFRWRLRPKSGRARRHCRGSGR